MNDILYATAYYENNLIVLAKDAPKGKTYRCIYCGNAMILKRSERQRRRPHFAHKNKEHNFNCSPQTVLHKSFIIILCERIRRHIDKLDPLPIKWDCKICGKPHSKNLTKMARETISEHNMGNFRPDIALINQNSIPFVAIEIIVKGPTKEEKMAFYKAKEIFLMEFLLKSEDDLEKATETPLHPTTFDFCPDQYRQDKDNEFTRKETTMPEIDPDNQQKDHPSPKEKSPPNYLRLIIYLISAIIGVAILYLLMK